MISENTWLRNINKCSHRLAALVQALSPDTVSDWDPRPDNTWNFWSHTIEPSDCELFIEIELLSNHSLDYLWKCLSKHTPGTIMILQCISKPICLKFRLPRILQQLNQKAFNCFYLTFYRCTCLLAIQIEIPWQNMQLAESVGDDGLLKL